jgi:FMN-dependent NADH-azoreductase
MTCPGPYGVVPAQRAVVITSRGSEYRAGTPMASLDHQTPYLCLILGFLGIGDVRTVNVDGQGPTYPNAAETLAAAELEVLAMAAEWDAVTSA